MNGSQELKNTTDGKSSVTSYIRVNGLDCIDCSIKLEQKIFSIPGVDSVTISFATGKMVVVHKTPLQLIIKAVNDAGYRSSQWSSVSNDIDESQRNKRRKLLLTLLSGVFLAVGLIAPIGLENILYFLSILIGGLSLFKNGLYSAKNLRLDMNFLMTVAVVGAMAIGQWSEGAAVVFLFSLGNLLQSFTMEKTKRSIRALMDLSPQQAVIKRGDSVSVLPIEQIVPGDITIVKPGQKIPADGKIYKGHSLVNQSPITGESAYVEKEVGDFVFAGAINGHGSLEVKITRRFSDSTLSKIIKMVEEAQGQKAPTQQLVDRFAAYYTPAVLLMVSMVMIIPVLFFSQPFTPWFTKALILLVISCPCALVISTPVAIVSAIGSAARNGVLIKGGSHLEAAGAIKIIAFDKTGTLTSGKARISEVVSAQGINPDQVLKVAASVEYFSEHHLAGPILEEAANKGLDLIPVTGFKTLPGIGAYAYNKNNKYYVGNERLFNQLGIEIGEWKDTIDRLTDGGNTVIIVGVDNKTIGVIGASDTVRPHSNNAVAALLKSGIEKIVMLTGDNYRTAFAAAKSIGISDVQAELMPHEKLDAIKRLKKKGKVAMVGDGINDAPALALADVGIAMGVAGTDAAIETADIALMADDLSKLSYTIRLSRKTIQVIKQNIIFAILIKVFFIVATFFGFATLWMAVFADSGATILVILNGIRLMMVKDSKVH